eukprot:2066465-Rhodomonas_salina.3
MRGTDSGHGARCDRLDAAVHAQANAAPRARALTQRMLAGRARQGGDAAAAVATRGRPLRRVRAHARTREPEPEQQGAELPREGRRHAVMAGDAVRCSRLFLPLHALHPPTPRTPSRASAHECLDRAA